MSDPKHAVMGNKADELGAHEEGADFGGINSSQVPGDVRALEVDVVKSGRNLILTRKHKDERIERGIELQDSPKELVNAQIFDDPAMMSRVSGAITRKSTRGQIVYYAVTSRHASGVWGDRVMIQMDTQESAYSCQSCKGTGHTEEQCPTCKGTRIDIDKTSPCRSCWALGFGREGKTPSGFVPCSVCAASGWVGGIVIPEISQSVPITGIVVSVGPECVNLQLGDRVLHSRYSGHQQTNRNGEMFTTMHEHEVLQLIIELPR